MDIGDLRREYMSKGLDNSDLVDDPIAQFEAWFKQAEASGMTDPNALSLATADEDGRPSVRTVLLKAFDEKGFTFFTNYTSRKGQQLAQQNSAAMLFPWLSLNRQIIIEGICEKVTPEESLAYFSSRPRGSQISASASHQSQTVDSRQSLEDRYAELEQKYSDQDIPLPEVWGGYRLVPNKIEFWQGRENRLHDRFVYELESGVWKISRLQP